MRLWKKAIAAMTAGVLCVGSVGMTGLQGVLESVGTVLSASAYVPYSYDGSTYEGLYYNVTDTGEIEIAGCYEYVRKVNIPIEIDGKSVTSIENYAFSYCTSLTEITIPDSVTSIGKGVFFGCTNLTKITIPDSVTSIGECAFRGCTSLTEITIPDSVASIGYGTFSGCTSLTKITIPDSVTYIEGRDPYYGDVGAFSYCTSLTEITIPDSVTSIGEYAFRGCTGLTEITIPDSVTSIGECVFSGCTGLTEITIPDSVTSIGEYAFGGCTSLTKITIPDSVTHIENLTFDGCTSLTKITIPDSVTSIGQYAFCVCTSLTEITIPDSVTSIGECVFSGCTGLTEITIPDSVKYIGEEAFKDCTNLKSITFLGSKTGIKEGAFSNCDADIKFTTEDTYGQEGEVASVATNVTQLTVKHKEGKIPAGAYKDGKRLKEVTLEEGITLIEDDAFANCDNLEKIVIPKSVTGIHYMAFTYDTKLTMYGYKDTYAERYAEMFGFPFVALDDSDTPPVTTTTTTSTTETTPTTAAPITGGLVCGDINLDGRVDITDAVLLNKFCSGAITLDDTAKKNADCNGDGEPGSGDAVVLLQFLVHIVDTLPYSA